MSDYIVFSDGSKFGLYIANGGDLVWFTYLYANYYPSTSETITDPPRGTTVLVDNQPLYAKVYISDNNQQVVSVASDAGRKFVIEQLKSKQFITYADDSGWTVDISAAGAAKAISLAIKRRPL